MAYRKKRFSSAQYRSFCAGVRAGRKSARGRSRSRSRKSRGFRKW